MIGSLQSGMPWPGNMTGWESMKRGLKFPDIINLQGDTVGEQLMEVALLTAEFGIAAFSVIGLTIGFPWGMILSLVLDLLLDKIRNGASDGYHTGIPELLAGHCGCTEPSHGCSWRYI